MVESNSFTKIAIYFNFYTNSANIFVHMRRVFVALFDGFISILQYWIQYLIIICQLLSTIEYFR